MVVLISGNGSNLQAIIDHCSNDVDIKAVVSDQPNAYGLQRAKNHNIPTEVVTLNPQEPRENYCERLIAIIQHYEPRLIVLAGFMKILTPNFIKAFPQTVNIHPSLLPKYKGLHTHRRVLEAGEKYHGITIHWVTEKLDDGPIVIQRQLEVHKDDTEQTLEDRIHRLEHRWYPHAIKMLAKNPKIRR